jgi:hypothetical protein
MERGDPYRLLGSVSFPQRFFAKFQPEKYDFLDLYKGFSMEKKDPKSAKF